VQARKAEDSIEWMKSASWWLAIFATAEAYIYIDIAAFDM
jgi:hypothetical protein